MALTSDGSLWAWGYNENGQLGDGTTTRRLSPVPVATNRTWTAVNASEGYRSQALATDGTLWAWGYNGGLQLGLGPWTQVPGGAVWGPLE